MNKIIIVTYLFLQLITQNVYVKQDINKDYYAHSHSHIEDDILHSHSHTHSEYKQVTFNEIYLDKDSLTSSSTKYKVIKQIPTIIVFNNIFRPPIS